MSRLKQAALVLGLFAFAMGLLALVGASHRRSFDEVRARWPTGNEEVEVPLDHRACRYLFPGPLELVLGRLVCRPCLAEAHAVHQQYEVRREQAHCGSRGTTPVFVRRRARTGP